MDDLDLDRELRAAFAVEPSPEFLARVRTTIAQTPSPSMTSRLLRPAAMIACTALVMFAFVPRESRQLDLAGLKPSTTTAPPDTTTVQPGATRVATIAESELADAGRPEARSVVVPTFPPPPPRRFGGRAVALAKAGRSARPLKHSGAANTIAGEPPLPEVIIAADDVEAFLQFVTGARDLRFVASFDETPISTPWVMTELSIAPIAVGDVESAPAHNN